ncbi:HEPN domain-containing protein [Candidatus Electrothrix aarhusensis]|jgi:HEPN domain-containing protein|uniref:HEPN domain-containing protein n=1 Tax=Candidatus Electrothrix aarhusensis TaxID=1859131 RepID=A0A3S3RSU0_9BACT|nr:HEPN domain-containing protein [Candidatus Electrothrix aarhusensis]
MRNETRRWLQYAEENFASARLLLQSSLFNPCLQNVQQAVEKALKAILIEKAIKLKKTHDILTIKYLLNEHGLDIDLSDDDCDFLNSIYLPSKYPVGSVLADYEPDETICQEAITIAEKALAATKQLIGS